MQDIWRQKLGWDESVPQVIHTTWLEFVQQLDLINQISFDRRVTMNEQRDIQLHGFYDASNIGYGTCLYVRSSGENDENATVKLLCAKSRVAPLKTTTMPRLELCGALMLARLQNEVKRALSISPSKMIFWCDSTIVLHWIQTESHLLNNFVSNRVTEIQKLTKPDDWRHVRSEVNPADAISRGQLPRAFLQNRMWFTGPEWLAKNENEWPSVNGPW